jgi:RHS repeat-associated protein
VNTFREVTLANGGTLDVPDTILCCFSERDIDPNAVFDDERTFDRFDGQLSYDGFGNIVAQTHDDFRGRYAWSGRELDVDVEMRHIRARCYDPTPGRWLSQHPLGYDAGASDLYSYPDVNKVLDSMPKDSDEDGK